MTKLEIRRTAAKAAVPKAAIVAAVKQPAVPKAAAPVDPHAASLFLQNEVAVQNPVLPRRSLAGEPEWINFAEVPSTPYRDGERAPNPNDVMFAPQRGHYNVPSTPWRPADFMVPPGMQPFRPRLVSQ